MKYQAHIIECMVQVSDFETGATGNMNSIPMNQLYEADTLPELLTKVADNYDVTINDLMVGMNSPDSLQLSRFENGDGWPPEDSELEAWKKGNEKLFIADYYAVVSKTETVNLAKELKKYPGLKPEVYS